MLFHAEYSPNNLYLKVEQPICTLRGYKTEGKIHHHLQCYDLMYRVCAIAVGGLTSPVKGPYAEPLYFADKPPDSLPLNNSSVDYEDEEEHKESVEKVITAERKTKELGDDNEEKEAESKRGQPFCPQMLISEPNHKKNNKITTVPELELRKLERGEVSLGVRLIVCFFC